MGELEELIADVKSNRNFDPLEMEFIHTRAKGLLQLLQLFDSKDNVADSFSAAEQKKVDELKESVEAVAERTEEISGEVKDESSGADKKEDGKPAKEIAEKEPDKIQEAVPAQQETPETVTSADQGIPAEKKTSPKPEASPEQKTEQANSPQEADKEGKDNEMLEEEEKKTESGGRLGDSFLKGKSVNDLITDQHKLEYKLSNRPVSSIQAAIGINDRFQYIRELFDGDTNKFMETVKALDSMQDIREAVDYLRKNFKWKKNETSLKFVNLVKRRFQND